MARPKKLAFALAVILSVGGALGLWVLFADDEPRYRRADCIVKVDVVYPEGISEEERSQTHNFLFRSLGMLAAIARGHIPTAGFSFGNQDTSKLYFRYWEDCERRFDYTMELIGVFLANYSEFVMLRMSRERVEPSMKNSVCFHGDYWIDGDQPCD